MAKGHISKTSVDALKSHPRKKVFLWDTRLPGFGVLITQKGRRVYVIQYRMPRTGGNPRRYTIGPHGPWTSEKARQRASELLLKVFQGIDPLEEEKAKRKAAVVDESLRFSRFAEHYLQTKVDGIQRQAKKVRARFRNQLIPWFKDKPIDRITAADIIEMLDEFAKRSQGAPLAAYKILRPMFTHAASRAIIQVNPFQNVKKPRDYGPRQRFLLDWEIQRVWEAAADMAEHPGGALAHMILLSGQRCVEVAAMSWSEINLERREWIIPGDRAKNQKLHIVPLTHFTVEYLDRRWPKSERIGFLFPGMRGGEKPIAGFVSFREILYRHIYRRLDLALQAGQDPNRTEITRFHYHDLRRTVSSTLASLLVPKEHTEALINHRSGRTKLMDTYQIYQYYPERVAAMELWHRHLRMIIERGDAWPGGRDLKPLIGKRRWKSKKGSPR